MVKNYETHFVGHPELLTYLHCICLVPRRLSLFENVRAKEGGKETTPAVCTLPMVPCGSLPVARLYLAKNKAPVEETDTA